MKVEELKEKARRHEQKEEWQKALDLYRDALRFQPDDEPPDINLFNRVGDLQTRLGQIEGAVKMYEQAIDHYVEAELPNNAIAICKKVLRNLPDRLGFFLRMGQIRAMQGFLTDARHSFLTYAERMTALGDLESALNALVEFVELSPEDVEIRLGLAAQLESHGRADEAAEQLSEAYSRLVLMDRGEEALAVAEKLREIAPDTLLPDPKAIKAAAVPTGASELQGEFGGFEFGSGIESGVAAGLPEADLEFEDVSITEAGERDRATPAHSGPEAEASSTAEGREGAEGPMEEVGASDVLEEAMEDEAGEEDEAAEPLPFLSLEEEEGVPTFGFENGDSHEEFDVFAEEGEESAEESEPLPFLEDSEEEKAEALPTFGFGDGEEFDVFAEDEEGEGGEDEPFPVLGLEEGQDAAEVMAEAIEEALGETATEEVEAENAEEIPADALGPGPDGAPLAAGMEDSPPPPASHGEAAARGELELAMEMVRSQIEAEPDVVDHYQRLVEYAFRRSDPAVLARAYMELAGCLARTGSRSKARAVYQQVLTLEPGNPEAEAAMAELDGAPLARPVTQVASSEEYVDLGAMILGEEAEKTTRWKVSADTPTGDDQADFAKMLSQFKKKVAEHVDVGDVAAHHDLGTAYMEMGLLEEAISEFQMALRAQPTHLPTFEVMGRCWMEMGKPDMALRTLSRALEAEHEVEDELIGIYYLVGRASEDLGNTAEAVEFYEKVFSLDINFVDVTERLRVLRQGARPPTR